MRRTLFMLSIVLATAGCAAVPQDGYPSLLPRPVESRGDAVTPVPVPAVIPDPILDAEIAALLAEVVDARKGFDAAAENTERLAKAGRGAAVGSEAWVDAQSALARLDGYRTQILSPVADLERLAIDRARTGLPPYPALENALRKAETEAKAQRDRAADIDAMTS